MDQQILNQLARPPALLDDTLVIRLADHGEYECGGNGAIRDIQATLDHELHEHMKHMGTVPSFTWPPKKTEKSRGGPPVVTAR